MAEAALEFLLENLKQLLVYNANLILDIKGQVESLYGELSLFKAFLKDCTDRRNQHETLKELVKQIRDVVYEAEDAIDSFVAHVAVHNARYGLKKYLHYFDYPAKLRSVGKDIETIKAKVKDIYDKKPFGFQASPHLGTGYDRGTKEKKPPVVEEDNVVGFEDEAQTVIDLLNGGSDELEVVSIIGMPGNGKTTLAKMIYRDPIIEYEFCNRAWVYISQDYSRKEVFLNILSNFVQLSDDMYRMNDESLVKEIYKTLEKGKYLIVMDDMWTEEAWNDLKVAFPKNNKGSRILITSRMKKVAKHANPAREPHNLRFLTLDESWRLLKRKALGSEDCPEELVRDGTNIARECGGLPLAIVVIGGILLEKGIDWWGTVARSVNAFISLDQEKRVDKFIDLSYKNLPYHLKACFIYLAMFPEDFEIPVWKLVRLWIAEGFIQHHQEINLEDIAEEYLEDLVNRNLVMVAKLRSNGKIKTCRIHDVLREFCKREAEEENFFHEIKCFVEGSCVSSHPSLEKYRRLCIHSRLLNYLSSKPEDQRVRSFLCFSNEETTLPDEQNSSIHVCFKLLRVLDIRSMTFNRFPTDLTQLVHLKYIVLSTTFKILPTAFSSLWNIQTLVILTGSRTLEIKADIWKMIQLRHVKTNASTILPSPGSKKRKSKDDVLMIASLQTLSTISPETCTEDVFSRSPNLKNLGIRGNLAKLLENNSGSTLFDSLGKLVRLENLKLLNDVFPRPPSEGKLASLPLSYKFPPKLKKLTLSDTLLDWEDMNILGMLENLEILKLKDHAFKGDWWQLKDGGFRALKVLHIGRTDLVTWKALADHFPRLRKLFLKHCTNLASLPLGFADVLSLQEVELYCTTGTAAASAREIQQKKMEIQGNQSTRGAGFKLLIYPPDQ